MRQVQEKKESYGEGDAQRKEQRWSGRGLLSPLFLRGHVGETIQQQVDQLTRSQLEIDWRLLF